MADVNFSLIRGADQWQRASYADAALIDGIVQLAWETPATSSMSAEVASAAGLAFDAHCRLYHSLPEAGDIERLLWSAEDPLHPKSSPEALRLFGATTTPLAGDFATSDPAATTLRLPRALAVDDEQRLFIAESGAHRLLVFDLWSQRLLRRLALPGEPVDLATDGDWVYVLLANPAALLRLRARTSTQQRDLAASITAPGRLCRWNDGRLLVLNDAGTATSQIIDAATGAVVIDSDLCAFASDIESYQPHDAASPMLVIARRAGEDFIRAEVNDSTVATVAPLTARAYDGRGIVRTPDQRIAYWTEHGLRYAVAARLRYARSGNVIGFRLDSGEYQTQWGRLFIDACIPREAQIKVRCIVTDEPPETGLVLRQAPVNVAALNIAHDELSPPLPAQWLVDSAGDWHSLYRRANGSELPWSTRIENDDFATYETPVIAAAGRYLWVLFELSGNSIVTPRIRTLRVEYPAHDYLRRLPRTLSREPETASFLQRYLALFAGQLAELSQRAERRESLLDPHATPAEALPWVASFLGLSLDERWSVASQRIAVAEAIDLFKRRGTIKGLTRFIEIVAGVRPIIIEKFRLRGGGSIGGSPALTSNAILGAGFRVGGAVGKAEDSALTASIDDAFETHAHRFTILIPGVLGEDELAMLGDLLDKHRPAHTLYELCTIGAGMRVGRGLHIGLSSAIGRSSAFMQLQLGASALGRGAVLGRPQAGIRPGATRLPTAFGRASHRGNRIGDSRVG